MKIEEEILTIISKSVKEFEEIENDTWNNKSKPLKWSKKQILGHLIDSALTNLRRFVMTQYEQKQKIIYHQDTWVEIQNYQETDIGEIIELWRLLNLQIYRVIKNIPQQKLHNICDTGKESIVYYNIEYLIADYIDHLKHHIAQITDN